MTAPRVRPDQTPNNSLTAWKSGNSTTHAGHRDAQKSTLSGPSKSTKPAGVPS